MKIDGTVNINMPTPMREVSAPVHVPNISTEAPEVVAISENSQEQKNAPSESTVKQAVSDINKKINSNTIARYGFHEETNRVTIKLIDKNSDEVIKEFPAEETLDMIAKVWELAGVFLDERG